MLNVHPSLLPRWRGAAPIERAIMAGDERTGVSIMRLTAGLDSGPVCAQASEPIAPDDTYGTLAARLQQLGGELLVRDPRRVARRAPSRTTRWPPTRRRSPPRTASSIPARPAAELERVVRALTPHIGAHVDARRRRPRSGVREARGRSTAGGPPAGVVSLATGRVPVLGCAEGALELLVVQPPGRRPMSGEDYLRGPRGG